MFTGLPVFFIREFINKPLILHIALCVLLHYYMQCSASIDEKHTRQYHCNHVRICQFNVYRRQ